MNTVTVNDFTQGGAHTATQANATPVPRYSGETLCELARENHAIV